MSKVRLIAALILAVAIGYPLWIGVQVYQQSNTDEVRSADAIVVLGAAQYDGEPSPVFKARLDQAVYLYGEGLADTVIVTGGKLEGDRFTEAQVGETYLTEHAVPAEVILGEDEGRTTLESLRNVWEIAQDYDVRSVLLVSDPMHSERIKRIATDLGFHPAYASWTSYERLDRSRWTKAKELVHEVGSIIVYEFLNR
jgi:uncharacterized SAM-binding protein YcdF (DUF218 family)